MNIDRHSSTQWWFCGLIAFGLWIVLADSSSVTQRRVPHPPSSTSHPFTAPATGIFQGSNSGSAAAPLHFDLGARRQLQLGYGRLPLSFEANRGQPDTPVKFLSRGIGYTLFLTSDEAVLALRKPSKATKPERSLVRLSTLTHASMYDASTFSGFRGLLDLPNLDTNSASLVTYPALPGVASAVPTFWVGTNENGQETISCPSVLQLI
jgi:hypothetical protein